MTALMAIGIGWRYREVGRLGEDECARWRWWTTDPLRNGTDDDADDDVEDYDYDDGDGDDDECSAEDDEGIISRTTVEIIVTTSFQKERMQENTVSLIMSLIKKGWNSFSRKSILSRGPALICDADHLSVGKTRIIQNFQLTTYLYRGAWFVFQDRDSVRVVWYG